MVESPGLTAGDLTVLIGAVVVGLTTIISAIFTGLMAMRTTKMGIKVEEVKSNVALIEKNTNSIKDALVAATKSAALAEGEAKGRADMHAEQGLIDRGKLQQAAEAPKPEEKI